MIRLTITGNTFNIKEQLKADGFRWNPNNKSWGKVFDTQDAADDATKRHTHAGVTITASEATDPNERKYMIKESWLFNLESMHDKAWCLIYDIRENKIVCPFEVAGKTINGEADMFDLMNEIDDLTGAARRRVTGKEYGRIREVVAWRVNARYAACMANGMDEADAGKCFEDM